MDRCEHTNMMLYIVYITIWKQQHIFLPWTYATQFDTGVEFIFTGKNYNFKDESIRTKHKYCQLYEIIKWKTKKYLTIRTIP